MPTFDFNPTLFLDETDNDFYLARVECWGHEVARVSFDPKSKPSRDWGLVVSRWGRMVISREFRRWEEGN